MNCPSFWFFSLCCIFVSDLLRVGQHHSLDLTCLLSPYLQDEVRALGESPPPFRLVPPQAQRRPSREMELSQNPSVRLVPSSSGLVFTGPNRLLQDCQHKPLKSLSTTHQPNCSPPPSASAHHTCTGGGHNTSHNSLHHMCQSTFQLTDPHNHAQCAHHFHHQAPHHSRPSSGHHTCPGFLNHRDSFIPAKPDASGKLSTRSSSYEKSSILSKSACSSKAASPMVSPRRSPHPSPCPSSCTSIIVPAAPPCSPEQPCSPARYQKATITDINRLSADSRPQQRGREVCGIWGCVYVCVQHKITPHLWLKISCVALM